MSKNKTNRAILLSSATALDVAGSIAQTDATILTEIEAHRKGVRHWVSSHRIGLGAGAITFLMVLGVMASNGWLPHTDGLTGKRTGWFGKEVAKSAPSSWNPFAMPTATATPTPQLSKEKIYAGISRLVAVEDANASAVPPADVAVWRPSNGYFYVLGGPNSATTYYGWGVNGDTPVPGDYDGDGKTDFAVVRPSGGSFTWYIVYSSTGSYMGQTYGATSDKLAVADYDGDGRSDVAVWRPSTGDWYIQATGGSSISRNLGTAGDVAAPADYDGDGKSDAAVWRGGSSHTFFSINSSDAGSRTTSYGASGDVPVCGDYDGDGKADLAVFRGSNGTWYIRQSSNEQTVTIPYGLSSDVLVQNDYDGDGKVDIAVWRPSTGGWWILQSHNSVTRNETWGINGDIPVPAFYRR